MLDDFLSCVYQSHDPALLITIIAAVIVNEAFEAWRGRVAAKSTDKLVAGSKWAYLIQGLMFTGRLSIILFVAIIAAFFSRRRKDESTKTI
jgi:hypothetical protein